MTAVMLICSGKCARGKSCRYSHDLPLPRPGCWRAGVPVPPAMMATLPHQTPQTFPAHQVLMC